MKTRRKAAFTLIEIMIVVVIIGLLAAMAIPAFQKVRAVSQDKAVTNNLRQLAFAAEQYMLETGSSSAPYSALVGAGTQYWLTTIEQVADETYNMTITLGDTQVSTTVNGRTITYTF